MTSCVHCFSILIVLRANWEVALTLIGAQSDVPAFSAVTDVFSVAVLESEQCRMCPVFKITNVTGVIYFFLLL